MPQEQSSDGTAVAEESGGQSFDSLLAANLREYGGSIGEESESDGTEEDGVDTSLSEDSGDSLDVGDEGGSEDEGLDDEGDEGARPARMTRTGRKPGFNEVLEHLESAYPEGAEVFRDLQAGGDRRQNEINSLNERLERLEKPADDEPAAEEEPEEEDEYAATEAQERLISGVLRKMGVVTQAQQQEQTEEEERAAYVNSALEDGIEQFGESFGVKNEDGTITLNEALQEDVGPILTRIREQGVTPLDLAVLSGKLTPAQADEERASEDATPTRGRARAKAPARRRARVADSSVSGGRAEVNFREGEGGNDPDVVFNRIWAQKRRQVRPTRR